MPGYNNLFVVLSMLWASYLCNLELPSLSNC